MNTKIGGSSPPRAVEQILSLSQLLGARLSGLRLPPAFPAARPAEKKSAAWWETFWFEAAACFPRRPARRKEIREPCPSKRRAELDVGQVALGGQADRQLLPFAP